jgi:hypothetical protein
MGMVSAPTARTRRIAALSAGPVAVVLAGALVWQGSTAAFTATTRNDGNSWSTGQVVLTDDDQGSAMFTVDSMVPGQSGENCITVTSGSTVPGEVRAYFQDLATSSPALNDAVRISLERGTGGGFGSCEGFTPAAGTGAQQPLSAIATTNTDYSSGLLPWSTAGTAGEQASYRISWTFDTSGLSQSQIDSLQGTTTSLDTVWELQSDDAA